MHNSKIKYLKVIIFLVIFIFLNNLIVFVICPKGNYSRKTINEMYYRKEKIDMVFIGSSYFVKDINPYIMNENMGINTFNYSFNSQLYMGTYYCLEEFFKYHKPKVVILSTDMDDYVRKNENVMAFIEVIPYIKSLDVKIKYLIESSKEGSLLSRLFWWRPSENHLKSVGDMVTNVKEKMKEDYINYPTEKQLESYENNRKNYDYIGKGFVRVDNREPKNVLDNNKLGKMSVKNVQLSDINDKSVEYFYKIVDLCKQNDSELLLIQPPLPKYKIFCQKNYFEFSQKIGEIAKEKNVDYYDFNLVKPELFKQDDLYFQDYAHFNAAGSDEFSKSFCEFLKLRDSGKDMDKYFYNKNEYLNSINYINNTWFTNKKDKDNIYLKAEAFYGSQVKPEYKFTLIDDKSKKKTILRDYDTDPEFTVKKPNLDKYKIRVDAREVGSNVEYSKYYEEEFKK